MQTFTHRGSAGEDDLRRTIRTSKISTVPSGTVHHRGEVTHICTKASCRAVSTKTVRVLKTSIIWIGIKIGGGRSQLGFPLFTKAGHQAPHFEFCNQRQEFLSRACVRVRVRVRVRSSNAPPATDDCLGDFHCRNYRNTTANRHFNRQMENGVCANWVLGGRLW